MYIFTLVDRVYKVVEKLRIQRGDYKLAMLYNSSVLDTPTGWNLIVSSDWTHALGVAPATRIIARDLYDELGPHERTWLSRITVLPTTDAFVRDMTRLYPVITHKGAVPLSHLSAGGITEGAGFVFYSQPEVPA